jgi:hypothetical protein
MDYQRFLAGIGLSAICVVLGILQFLWAPILAIFSFFLGVSAFWLAIPYVTDCRLRIDILVCVSYFGLVALLVLGHRSQVKLNGRLSNWP